MIRCFRSGPVRAALVCAALASALPGCDGGGAGAARWDGSVDTLRSGQVVVRNTANPVWGSEARWRTTETLRIGRVEGEGPDAFGSITSLEVDEGGRIWIIDGQAQELRVFDSAGAHVRTIGRRGGGPGEFAQAVQVERAPDGRMWVMDPRNNRVSVFDTAGTLSGSHPAMGGFVIIPWPGGFDGRGRYFAPVPIPGEGFRLALVGYDAKLDPVDTLSAPPDPLERGGFELSSDRGRIVAGIPFSGRRTWRLTERGSIMALITDQYRLFEVDADGDTLRTITREYDPLPVTDADRERARADLEWFTRQGGRIDLSRLPATKPAAEGFFEDEGGNVWVQRVVADSADEGHVHDVFDPEGRFLGTVRLPFALERSPAPVFWNGALHGVTRDALGVQYIVRAAIERP